MADVLLAVIDRTSGSAKGVAVLIQAKTSAAATVALSSKSEKTQFDLLSVRPKFDVDAVSAPTKIDLSRRSTDSALMYGLTSSSAIPLPSAYSGTHHWLTIDNLLSSFGTYSVTGKDCLAFMLVGMLSGNFGWDFNLPPIGHDWKALEAATPRDDWSTLISYLLEETFAKPLSATHSASMGRPSRGQEDVLYMTSISSSGHPMFFLGYEIANSIAMQRLSQGRNAEAGGWEPSNINDVTSVSGGGNFTGAGSDSMTGNPPESGPISAILFEIGRQG